MSKRGLNKKLKKLMSESEIIPIDDRSKIVFFSDCHRGYGGRADDFAHNQLIFISALRNYYDDGYTYIELGDGDELWENKDFERIKENYRTIFELFDEFHQKNRFYLLWGNHNRKWKKEKRVRKEFSTIIDDQTGQMIQVFKDLVIYESLVLRYKDDESKEILLVHGHQGELVNDKIWWFGRFFVRNFWKFFQSKLGMPDPTSAARNYRLRRKSDEKFKYWVGKNEIPLIIGHTHKSVFPLKSSEPSYFNDGSCVHPRCITGIEIDRGNIQLVKWFVDVSGGSTLNLYVNKKVLAGTRSLAGIF